MLSVLIKKNPSIKGIQICGTEVKISQYADDTTLLLDRSQHSLNHTLDCIDHFYNISGLKINETKTNAIWIGINKYSPYQIKTRKKIHWVKDGLFSCLGIDFSLCLHDIIEINYENKYLSIKKQIQTWSKRNISVLARVTVVKSLFIPQLNHVILSIPNPSEDFIKKLQSDLLKFNWKRNDKVKRSQMTNKYKHGGVKMIAINEFFNALKITWIRRLINNTLDKNV
jgi:hypothetical protein